MPDRISSPLAPNYRPTGLPHYPFLVPKAIARPISNLDRVPLSRLRRFTRTPPAHSVTQKITRGVLGMNWWIEPPSGEEKNELAIALAVAAHRALLRPNEEIRGNWRSLASAAVSDMLTINHSFIERHPGTPDRPFWLFSTDSAKIRINKDWNPQNEGITPQFWEGVNSANLVGIMRENMFMLVNNVNSHELIPPSPLEIAYNHIEAWLGVSDFQTQTTRNATHSFIIDIGEASQEELNRFREYWNLEVVTNKGIPTLAAGGRLSVIPMGATSDEGLYPKYCDYLMRIIAMCFALSNRDANLTDHDNRATAEASADSTFALAIKPIAQILFEGIQTEVLDRYLPGFQIKVDYSEPRSEAARNFDIREDYKAGLITRNEGRMRRGEMPLEDDVFFNGAAVGDRL